MTRAACSDEEFIALWKEHKSAKIVSDILNVAYRAVQKRRSSLEKKYDIILHTLDSRGKERAFTIPEDKIRAEFYVDSGYILVGSDCHYWPGEISTAHRAFVHLTKTLKPKMVILNGDLLDGSTISTHHRIGYENRPNVKQELEALQERLGDIEKVRPAGCILHRTIGNHDLRFDGKLSNVLPQYEGIFGMALADHIPHWSYSWSVFINENTMIKHRYHNGIHAVYNNTLKSGCSMVTGHLHSLKVTPWTDYTGDRYGVDTGTMSMLGGSKFNYLEDNPVNWRSGFAVLTFHRGMLMFPELVSVIDEEKGLVFFRGEILQV